jgi:putative ABC transport system substrate-binding protein
MNKKFFVWLLTAVFLTTSLAQAQQPAKMFRIGYLSAVSPTDQTLGVFRRGLSELGYVEGKNFLNEYRFAEGKLDRLPALAADLVRLKVDVIVTRGPSATRPAKEATATIPIVMAQDPDPVGNGFVASLARPGGNITGLSSYSAELNGKQLELLKETVPRLARVAVLGHSTNPGNVQALKDIDLAAGVLHVKVLHFDISDPKSIESVFRAANKERADGTVVVNNPFGGTL